MHAEKRFFFFNHHSQHISDYVLFDKIFGIKFVFILFFKYLHLFI